MSQSNLEPVTPECSLAPEPRSLDIRFRCLSRRNTGNSDKIANHSTIMTSPSSW
ncbi:hypothetical protein BofuT4_uP122810.1 [Botrytis cinerea T4]|uniref:Uncharacterized protein n=1 Tax=Botryotinia fuckeliana (strain T4) TaxID=999810 RepID=G2YNR4_BOTF4|nr:hypothetical protein BofuT4_uP122810.1 [Botrytis cinerea T4]